MKKYKYFLWGMALGAILTLLLIRFIVIGLVLLGLSTLIYIIWQLKRNFGN